MGRREKAVRTGAALAVVLAFASGSGAQSAGPERRLRGRGVPAASIRRGRRRIGRLRRTPENLRTCSPMRSFRSRMT